MTVLRIAGLIVMSAVLLRAEDFTLKYFGDGPIQLHTTLTFDGKGERLIATAKNESGAPIQKAKICIASASVKKGCLFEVWNTVVWVSGAELSWNTTTSLKVADLSHQAMIEEYAKVDGAEPPSTPVSAVSPITRQESDHPAPAQKTTTKVQAGAKVFIAPMEGGLDGFLPPEFQKLKLPILIVLDEKLADYVLTGVTMTAGSAWYDVLAGGVIAGKDKFESNVKLVNVAEKTLTWSASAGDRSVLFGYLRRGGQRKIAERIAKQMKDDLFP